MSFLCLYIRFIQSIALPLILRECAVFHLTYMKPGAHFVWLACSGAKGFTRVLILIYFITNALVSCRDIPVSRVALSVWTFCFARTNSVALRWFGRLAWYSSITYLTCPVSHFNCLRFTHLNNTMRTTC
jgi:hypothetical protein